MAKLIEALLDMDGIIANLLPPFIEQANNKYGYNLTLPDFTTFNYLMEAVNKEHTDAIIGAPGFFKSLQPIPGAKKMVKVLQDCGIEFYILSSQGKRGKAVPEKDEWLDEHFPSIDYKHRIYTPAKHMTHADILIDDSPENIANWLKRNPKGITASIKYEYTDMNHGYTYLAHDYKNMESACLDLAASIIDHFNLKPTIDKSGR